MEIRQCKMNEVERVGAFYDGVVKYLDEHVNYPRWIYKVYPTASSAQEMTEQGCQFVCLDDGEIVGAFVLNEDSDGEYLQADGWSQSLSTSEYLVCHALATATHRQRQGIGKRIVQFCINYSKAHDYKAIRLDVVPDNTPAKKLYESFGFKYVCDNELGRGYKHIPTFSLYELNL